MPAVREVGVGIKVEQAVVAPIDATELLERMWTQDRPIHHVLPLEPFLAVDLFRLGRWDLVVRHAGRTYSGALPTYGARDDGHHRRLHARDAREGEGLHRRLLEGRRQLRRAGRRRNDLRTRTAQLRATRRGRVVDRVPDSRRQSVERDL